MHVRVHTHTHTHTHCRVAADVKSVVYSVGVAYGGEEEWDFVWSQYLLTSDPYEKRLYLSAMAKSQTPWILSR